MNRVSVVFLTFACTFIFVIYRLFTIQVLNSGSHLPLSNYVHFSKRDSLRGEIFDRNGQPLAINRKVYEVYADIDGLKTNEKLQKDVKRELQIKESTLSALLRLDKWRRVQVGVSEEKRQALIDYYPTYLNFEEGWTRYYPEGSSSAYLLGFVGKDDAGEPKGYLGLEGYFNRELSGLPIAQEQETDVLGIPFIGGKIAAKRNSSGFDIYSTIDITVQKLVERYLLKGVERYEAKRGCALVMDPYTGEVISMACVPGFDQRTYYTYEAEDFINPLVSSVYEPGSTFKPLIAAMALNEKKVTPRTKLDEEGPLQVGEYSIKTWNESYRGTITVEEALQKSSNVGMVGIIRKLKKKKVDEYITQLGLRSSTGIELEGEAESLIKDYTDWYPIDFATISFGQGMAISPIQLMQAFAAIANDGYIIRPTLIGKMIDVRNNRQLPATYRPKQKIFNAETVAQMKKMLFNTVDKAEAYWPNKPYGYEICGKTGTAQIPIEGHYDPTRTIASFIGFLPCDKPRFISLVLYYEPKKSPWGSETAAPTFFDIANSLLVYYNIAPDK